MTTTEPEAPPAPAPAALPEILVQRLPGASCWTFESRRSGRRSASPNPVLVAQSALDEVRRLGGRAVIVYDDQDDMDSRARRKRLGQETVNAVFVGARYWVRWSPEHQAFEPCTREESGSRLIMRVDDIDHTEDGQYVHRNGSGMAATRPLSPNEIVHLVTVDGEVPA